MFLEREKTEVETIKLGVFAPKVTYPILAKNSKKKSELMLMGRATASV